MTQRSGTALLDWRAVVAWFGDRLPDPLGSWLLRLADDSEEPWLDDEGRIIYANDEEWARSRFAEHIGGDQ